MNTANRVFSIIRSIINIGITEMGLECSNASSNIFTPSIPIVKVDNPSPKKYRKNKEECHILNDDMRW